MPPYVPRKRPSPAPEAAPVAKKRATPATKNNSKKQKTTLFDAIDAPKAGASIEETRTFLANLGDDDSDLSDLDSDEFEDVTQSPPSKRRKLTGAGDDDGEDSDEMDFEDVDMSHHGQDIHENIKGGRDDGADDDQLIEDITVSLNDDGTVAAETGTAGNKNVKKGPSKRDRQIRLRTHMIHVQSLVFHNAVRNSWLNDRTIQSTLVNGLSDGVKKEVDRWKIDMGYKKPEDAKKGKKGKRKSRSDVKDKRDGRDWGIDADRLESGVINMSRGDPLMRLLKVLVAFWKKRFTITAPGIRKVGYMPLRRLADDVKHWEKNQDNAEEHGERIESIERFRELARNCEGSRDVGAQLFTALLRGLGIEARMVASLQPVGFGWSKAEDAAAKRPKSSKLTEATSTSTNTTEKPAITISDSESDIVREIADPKATSKSRGPSNKAMTPQKPIRKSKRGGNPIVDQSDSSELSSVPSDDDASIVDITHIVAPASKQRPTKKFDRDLHFPHYWTEVLSPVSKTFIPVDSIVLSTVASNAELLSTFEPRGRASDQAKQVICYTLAYNADNTAKDVTVRYLKKHQLPGRTKGFRIMPERVPIHNRRGKVLRYEEQDWFATVILPFLRPQNKRTEADDKEEETDLKPFKPAGAGEGKQKIGEESLQWYKQSADFVLERHLRREEALLPRAKPVRTFTFGKGEKATSEPVFSRSDVVTCKTVESWHKEGRQIKVGEQPLKMVPVRAVTLIRKREMEEAQRETGEKLKQGLYSLDQTEWIIPPPIGPDRRIPKNAFGNMDCYVPSMVPRGAVHIKLKGCAKLCRKLDIDHAEACVGFEFGKQRAVPILFGVVVAEENEQIVRDAWRAEQEIQRRKEDVKREALMLHLWRKFVMGLRIVERMKAEYKDNGGVGEEVNPFVNRERQQKQQSTPSHATDVEVKSDNEDGDQTMGDAGSYDDDGAGGGFFLPGEEEALLAGPKPTVEATIEEDHNSYSGEGGFILDDDEGNNMEPPPSKNLDGVATKPMSLQSAHRKLSRIDATGDNDPEDFEQPSEDDRRSVRPLVTTASPAKTKRQTLQKLPASSRHKKTLARSVMRAKGNKRVASPSESDDASASDLTDLSSASEKDEADVNDDNNDFNLRSRRSRGSPRVVITPRMSRLDSTRSRFFRGKARDIENDTAENGAEESDAEEEEEEVVKPRRTTARTRKTRA